MIDITMTFIARECDFLECRAKPKFLIAAYGGATDDEIHASFSCDNPEHFFSRRQLVLSYFPEEAQAKIVMIVHAGDVITVAELKSELEKILLVNSILGMVMND